MRKIVQYLYEYRNGRQIQNVGFVRGEYRENNMSLQIYGRGFRTDENPLFEIFMVYLEDENCIGISMGTIRSQSPVFGYRLEYDIQDVGGKDIFDRIGGIVISSEENGNKLWYGATWDGMRINPEQMISKEEYEEKLLKTATLEGEEELEEEIAGEIEWTEPAEEMEDAIEAEEAVESEEAITEAEKAVESEEAITETEENAETEVITEAEEAERLDEKDQIFKITREDLVKLPRAEWKLANNHFLLHGYRNYHHLVSFEKEGACWIGVPGIYHPNEEKVAYSFGFDQFMKPDEGEVELTEEQMDETENFGYWCRRVSSVIGE